MPPTAETVGREPSLRQDDPHAWLLEEVDRRGLTHVTVGCFDWNGRLRAKQLHARNLAKALDDGTAITSAIFATDTAEQPILCGPFHDPANGYRDARLVLDPACVREDPFDPSGAGLLLPGQLGGDFAAHCPRALLATELARYTALALEPWGGFELECHLLAETAQSLRTRIPSAVALLSALDRMYSYVDHALLGPVLGEMRTAASRMDLLVDTLHTEFQGLLEAALAPARGMAIADDAALFKTMTKAAARRHGALACYMARLSNAHESAGAHLNVSLRADDRPVFHAPASPGRPSAMLLSFVAGLQRYTPELFLLHCPHVNSFKRLHADSLAPRTNTWAIDNKTAAFRVVLTNAALARVEVRVPGADVNPYLALAACLAAGRRGIEQALEPAAEARGNAWEADAAARGAPFPRTLEEAIAGWRGSALAREVFGAAFVDAFARSRDWEIELRDRTVSDWELRQFGEGA